MAYVRVTGRVILNVHSLNCEGAVGNYVSLSKMYIVRRTNKGLRIDEEAVVSGNMLKHWHALSCIEVLRKKGYKKLCDWCARGIMYRTPIERKSELEYIENCAIEDLHGFLHPVQQMRRESLIKFSFMIPIEEFESKYSAITHNRVGVTKEGKIDRDVMMIFKREYASGIYGFQCSMDLAYTGVCQADPLQKINDTDRRIRVRTAILALINMLSGHFGAAQARATAIARVLELIVAVSKHPIPNLIHGFYYDYAEESLKIIKSLVDKGLIPRDDLRVYYYGDRLRDIVDSLGLGNIVVECSTFAEALSKAAEDAEKWI